MKNIRVVLSIALLVAGTISAQTEKMIEVAVHETVENRLVGLSLYFSVNTPESQQFLMEDVYDEGYDEGIYDDYPDTYIDESLPAKERKRLEAEYQKALDEWSVRAAEREAQLAEEREKRLAEIELLTSQEAMNKLKANGYAFYISGERSSQLNYLAESASDTLLVVEVKDSADFVRLMSLFNQEVVHFSVRDLRYEKTADKLEKVFPGLMESADKQAKMIATASGKKIGPVAQITNVYPGFSPILMERQMDEAIRLGSYFHGDEGLENPFITTEKRIVEYIFRYPMVN